MLLPLLKTKSLGYAKENRVQKTQPFTLVFYWKRKIWSLLWCVYCKPIKSFTWPPKPPIGRLPESSLFTQPEIWIKNSKWERDPITTALLLHSLKMDSLFYQDGIGFQLLVHLRGDRLRRFVACQRQKQLFKTLVRSSTITNAEGSHKEPLDEIKLWLVYRLVLFWLKSMRSIIARIVSLLSLTYKFPVFQKFP